MAQMRNTDVVKGAEAIAQLASEMDPRTHEIIGAAMGVHSQLGHGFLEAVYQEALAAELALRAIEFAREVELVVVYKNERLRCGYRADFVCYGDIIVELKAMPSIGATEQAQLINYLKATGFRLGLLLNFGSSRLQVKRLRFDPEMVRGSGGAADTQEPLE